MRSSVTTPAGSDPVPGDLPAAVLAQSSAENFPVAPVFLPRPLRRDLMALYGFARLVDDIGDETAAGLASPGDRLALLDEIESQLDELFAGGTPRLDLLARLRPTLDAHRLSAEPFRRLLEANRQDQRVTRYDTFDCLLGYCALSADPVGHLVLGVLDSDTPGRRALSDRICTALQIVEHLQDVAEDHARGRIYLPRDDMDRFGVSEDDLTMGPTPDRVRRLVAFQANRAGDLLTGGLGLVADLSGAGRIAVAGFAAGGRAALRAMAKADFDVLPSPVRAPKRRLFTELIRVLAGPRPGVRRSARASR